MLSIKEWQGVVKKQLFDLLFMACNVCEGVAVIKRCYGQTLGGPYH